MSRIPSKETRSAYQRAAVRTPASYSYCSNPPQQIRRTVVLPVKQAGPQPQKIGLTSNPTCPTTKSNPFLLPKKQTCSFGERWLGLAMRGEKREKIRLVGTISRRGMRFATQPSKPQIVESGCLRRARRPSSVHDIMSRAENVRSFRRRAEQLSIPWEKAS